MASNLGRFTNTVTAYNSSDDAWVAGYGFSLNGFSFVAYENIASGASGTVVIPVTQEVDVTLPISVSAAFGTPIYASGTSSQTLSVSGTSVSVYLGRSLTSVTSVAAAQTISVGLYEAKPSFTV
jgi:hypothetical protein